MNRVLAEHLTALCSQTARIQRITDRSISVPLNEHGKDQPDSLCLPLVDYQLTGNRIDIVPERWDTANVPPLPCIFLFALFHLSGQIAGIILCHSFQHRLQDDALRAAVNIFGNGKQLHAAFFQPIFVVGTVVSISGKSVELMHNHSLKLPGCSVRDHPLELWTLV